MSTPRSIKEKFIASVERVSSRSQEGLSQVEEQPSDEARLQRLESLILNRYPIHERCGSNNVNHVCWLFVMFSFVGVFVFLYMGMKDEPLIPVSIGVFSFATAGYLIAFIRRMNCSSVGGLVR